MPAGWLHSDATIRFGWLCCGLPLTRGADLPHDAVHHASHMRPAPEVDLPVVFVRPCSRRGCKTPEGSRLSGRMRCDEELMSAVSDGDLDAFEAIVLRHQAEAWRVAYRFTGDAAEAEDLVQEAFLRILEAAERYRPTASFRTYLYRVLTRLCLDHRRKKRPVPTHSLPPAAPDSASPAHQMSRDERDAVIQTALDALPDNQRVAIVLRYFERLSGAEMAKAMGLSAKAVERLLARARRALEPRLRGLLED